MSHPPVTLVGVRTAYRVRQAVNAVTLATLLGLALAKLSRTTLHRGPDGLVLATGAQRPLLPAWAFTVGNVVITRDPAPSATLLAHEGRHASQWACCVVLFLPLYWLAALWSWARAGDHWSRNVFECRAGLVDGGYTEHPLRPFWTRFGRG